MRYDERKFGHFNDEATISKRPTLDDNLSSTITLK